jgi:hypothetical protein
MTGGIIRGIVQGATLERGLGEHSKVGGSGRFQRRGD